MALYDGLCLFFDIGHTAFSLLGYDISWVELLGTFFGLWCVIETARERVISWPVGLVNVILFFILFYQIRLYSDMLLQVYFFITGVYGWWMWTHPRPDQAKHGVQLRITVLPTQTRWIGLLICGAIIAIWGRLMSDVHLLLPRFFPQPAAFPYWDAATTVLSMVAQWLLTRKKLESWLLWITVDVICVAIYLQKEVLFLSMEYGLFLVIATCGFFAWLREHRRQEAVPCPEQPVCC